MGEELEVVLEGGKPWGIRLQGGVGSSSPLQIASVTPESKAWAKCLENGSLIIEINGVDAKPLTILEAQELVKNTGNTLRLRIREPCPLGDGGFYKDIMNSVYSGEGSWRSREAKGNTFNMMKEHVEAGQGNRVLSQFDVAQGQRNKALPTTAPKVYNQANGSSSTTDGNDDEVFSKERSNSDPARLVIMRGGKPWGMRLKGGSSTGSPLTIASVNPGSKAYNEGLLVNDQILSINNQLTENMTLFDAQEIIKEAGDELTLYITREAMKKRLMSEADEDFFNDLKKSMSITETDRRGRDVKGNAFKMLQNIVDSQ